MGPRLHNASYKHPFGLRCRRLQDEPIAMPPGNCSRWQFVIRRAALHSILFRRAVRPPQRVHFKPGAGELQAEELLP